MKYIVHTDGGARGNPGPAAIGVVIDNVTKFGKRIGETTNNVAEYTAVVEALTYIKRNGEKPADVHFFLDSNLVVQQLNGHFKVKDAQLKKLVFEIKILEQEVGGEVTYAFIPRERNSRADRLVNDALDRPHVSLW